MSPFQIHLCTVVGTIFVTQQQIHIFFVTSTSYLEARIQLHIRFCLTVGLFPGDALNVNYELATVARLDLPLSVLERATDNHHLITLSYGQRPYL